jgi:hypothetical protein
MRRLIATSGTLALATLLLASTAKSAPARRGTVALRSGRAPGAGDLVQAALEVGGDLKMVEEGKVRRVKMNVEAKFVYHEKSLQVPAAAHAPMRSVRHYDRAEGEIQSGDHPYNPSLREDRRLIGVEVDRPEVTLFSPQGPLTFDELDLIDVLANSLVLDRLLPQKPVAVQSPWKHPDDVIAAMLGLDTITESDVRSVLTGIDGGEAKLEISGRVAGAERGVSTALELKGKYRFDLTAKRITWFGLLVREDRSVGQVDTGFDVVARLVMKITPGRQSDHLTDAALAGFPLEPTPELTQLSYEPAGGTWLLAHDRRWHVVTEEASQAVMRLIDDGDKLAQCNVALLPQAADAAQLTLEAFQENVVRALDENFASLARASQHHNEADYRVFRIVAEGETSSVPMLWIYYLVTDEHGRRVVLAFVLERAKLDRFQKADEQLVGALRLAEPKVASKPDKDAPPDGAKR